jgi:hypothetical protein
MMGPEKREGRRWVTWFFLLAFLLVAIESVLVAIVYKGTMFVLLAPGAVCTMKAMELWKVIRKQI